jgi:L-threonylcarbamoyladenylate synthase
MGRITQDIQRVVAELNAGHIVGLPTETVYGLAADATNELAIRKIFETKRRPLNHPLIMHIGHPHDLLPWVEEVPAYAQILMKKFWPGPLTFIFKLKKNSGLSPLITAHQETIAIRSPAHPLALKVLNLLGRPIVAPSANPFGKISPTQAKHVLADFPEHTFSILDGGACQVGIESTLLYCIEQTGCSILRQGIIHTSELSEFCHILKPDAQQHAIKASGNLKHHYQPEKPLFYFRKDDLPFLEKQLLLHTENDFLAFSAVTHPEKFRHLFSDCPKKAAKEFYRILRQIDSSHQKHIFIELPPEKPEWQGLIERIKKAGVCHTQFPKCLNIP